MAFTQFDRLLRIDTPLGPDVLLLQEFTGQEGLSQLYKYDVEVITEGPSIDYQDIIGKAVTIRLELSDMEERVFHGYVSRFAQTGSESGILHYRAEIVPWLWFLTRTADCRIFQNKMVPDIIEQIFQDLGFTDYRLDLQGTYESIEYCVQYRETDFNFVSRLMEQFGIFYFFEHEETKHTLVLGDAASVHQVLPTQAFVSWEPEGSGILDEDVITSLEFEKVIQPGKFAHTDYNFKTPSTNLLADVPSLIDIGGNAQYEYFDFPGEYLTKAQGDTLARIRMETEEAQHFSIMGHSTCRAFASGYQFTLMDYYPTELNQGYVLTSVSHMASMGNTYRPGGDTGQGASYANSFRCLPGSVLFRPPRLTAKPVVQGAQTAMVVGKPGEEIWTDEFGRVKVLFHWDREGRERKDDTCSCWIRVSQVHAGKGFGGVDIPRVGEEVIVGFLEGDPDQPIIIGRVYNKENMPPNGLPGSGMVSGLKSNTTPGGGGNNCMMMDDTKGKEKISIHSQYDMDTTIEHDETQTVHNDRTITVDGTHTENIKKDTTITIIEGNLIQKVSAGTASQTVNKDISVTSESTCVHITAATEIKLSVGASTLLMKSDGTIELSGIDIAVKGSASVTTSGTMVTSEATAQHQTKGAIVVSDGSGTNTVKGGMVMLNP